MHLRSNENNAVVETKNNNSPIPLQSISCIEPDEKLSSYLYCAMMQYIKEKTRHRSSQFDINDVKRSNIPKDIKRDMINLDNLIKAHPDSDADLAYVVNNYLDNISDTGCFCFTSGERTAFKETLHAALLRHSPNLLENEEKRNQFNLVSEVNQIQLLKALLRTAQQHIKTLKNALRLAEAQQKKLEEALKIAESKNGFDKIQEALNIANVQIHQLNQELSREKSFNALLKMQLSRKNRIIEGLNERLSQGSNFNQITSGEDNAIMLVNRDNSNDQSESPRSLLTNTPHSPRRHA